MYNYIIRIADPDGDTQVELLHEKEFTKQEFDEMSAECFALSVKNEYGTITEEDIETINLDSYVYSCANIMSEKYGFSFPPVTKITQTFITYWYIDRNSETPNAKLLYKHIDKLLNK